MNVKVIWMGFKRMLCKCFSLFNVTPVKSEKQNQITHAITVPHRKRPVRGQTPPELRSIGSLLANLDEMFESFRLPFGKLSWVPRSRITGLRKLGVHVTYVDGRITSRTLPPGEILPTMMCVSFGWSRHDTTKGIYPVAVFGIKEHKLPAEVDKKDGQHYLYGVAFKLGRDFEGDANKEIFWLAGYITVLADGTLYVHKELRPTHHVIPISNQASRRFSGPYITYTSKQWSKAALAKLYDSAASTAGEIVCIGEFATAMNWWISRKENWSVTVFKSGERLTFSIPKKLTARFFKDRIKVTNQNGHTKKIIHHVSEHNRAVANGETVVKEHIRGLSEFNWNGYDCRVLAPTFNGLISSTFTDPGEVFEEDDDIPNGYIDTSKLGALLAEAEDGRMAA